MTLPPQLLYAISQVDGGQVVLVIGAGSSVDAPTSLPMADQCSLTAHRSLLADGILATGECTDPSDLTRLADTVIAKTGKQLDLVQRLPRERFRKAQPNLGHLLAAAMLRERALSCVMTLNFDLSMTSALVDIGGDDIRVIARPEEFRFLGNANLIYLHYNVDADAEEWILSSEALNMGWQNGWQQIVAQKVIGSPVTVFIGLGTPVAVILESTHLVMQAIPDGASVFQVDPGSPENSVFFQRLGIERQNYIQMTWVVFMEALSHRLAEEHVRLLKEACDGLVRVEGLLIEPRTTEELCGRLLTLELLGMGKLRASFLLSQSNYVPHYGNFNVEWLADLLLGIHYIESVGSCTARICQDGVVEFTRDGRPVGTIVIMSGRGFWRWLTTETKINQYHDHWRSHLNKPLCVLASGITDGRPANVAPPKQLIGDDGESVVGDTEKLEMYTVGELRANPELVRRFISYE